MNWPSEPACSMPVTFSEMALGNSLALSQTASVAGPMFFAGVGTHQRDRGRPAGGARAMGQWASTCLSPAPLSVSLWAESSPFQLPKAGHFPPVESIQVPLVHPGLPSNARPNVRFKSARNEWKVDQKKGPRLLYHMAYLVFDTRNPHLACSYRDGVG